MHVSSSQGKEYNYGSTDRDGQCAGICFGLLGGSLDSVSDVVQVVSFFGVIITIAFMANDTHPDSHSIRHSFIFLSSSHACFHLFMH